MPNSRELNIPFLTNPFCSFSNKIFVGSTTVFALLVFGLSSCSSRTNHDVKEPFSMSKWKVEVDFPRPDVEIDYLEKRSPDYPEHEIKNWVQEIYSDSGYFYYFVVQSTLSAEQRKDAQLFDQGFCEFIEVVLGGGMKNHDAINIHYRRDQVDSLYAMTATGDIITNSGSGNIEMKAYTNGYQLVVLGSKSYSNNRKERDRFFQSLKLTVVEE